MEAFDLVRLRADAWGMRSREYGEVCHPGIGPRAEAEALYVHGLRLPERWLAQPAGEPFVVWDVGLGGGANALAVLNAAGAWPVTLRMVSFDRSIEGFDFALRHAGELGYFGSLLEPARAWMSEPGVELRHGRARIQWDRVLGDFSTLLAEADAWPAPHAILFDPHSPAANPEMWTLPVFEGLAARCDPARPCTLATYSRATAVRAALLLAGFRVGMGAATGTKEETTVAGTTGSRVDGLLGRRWLERAERSTKAEPWRLPPYRDLPLQPETRERLLAHTQFAELTPGSPDSPGSRSR
ncbi:MAG: methyltransferase [Verrucomicrobiae bacterium]|nr:methyltransferase [Verrucomicrobiae bacterium]